MSHSLQGGFLTIGPPGKSYFSVLRWKTLENAKTRLDKMGSKESKMGQDYGKSRYQGKFLEVGGSLTACLRRAWPRANLGTML